MSTPAVSTVGAHLAGQAFPASHIRRFDVLSEVTRDLVSRPT